MNSGFERVVTLVNPACTGNVNTIEEPVIHRLEELRGSKYGRKLLEITTHPESERTQELLHDTLQAGDVLCVVGGEGTVNAAVRALVDPGLSHLEIPIVPTWDGNGHDTANMLNGQPKPISDVLDRGVKVPIHPIDTRVHGNGEPRREIAAVYMGIGAGAIGAARLNDKDHRKRRFYKNSLGRIAYEVPMLLESFVDAQEFMIQEGDEPEPKPCYDITVANGPRIAKFAKLPINLLEEELFTFRVERKNTTAITRRMLALGLGVPSGRYLKKEESLEFTVLSSVAAHFDAEHQILEPGTDISIQQHTTPYFALSTQ